MLRLIAGLFFLTLSFSAYSDGLTLGATRLIYLAGKKEASIPIMTTGDAGPYLLQTWVSNMDKTTHNIPFITTPPLFKIGRDDEQTVRVVDVGSQLPQDRESVFLLNVRAVPAVKKEANPERLIIATQNIIKLIYRPSALNSKDAGEAFNKLTISFAEGGIRVSNPTPYAVTLANMTVNSQQIDRPGVVMPFAELTIPLRHVPLHAKVTFSTINDFGGLTPMRQTGF